MVLSGLNEEVQEIIDLAGFAPLFEICSTADQARVVLAH
jgi:anti-anti-sigma regulatory factor